ncbi:MAG: CoB--CoM heterodisulfide reductase iron-sulfur subunit B family protein [Dehalococcoidia bacterium]|jgi:heterodisulfide reductase subunit B
MIETTRYAYYPGCCAKASAKEYDATTRLVCRALGIDLVELEDWVCCGASSAHSVDKLLGIALPAQELQSAARLNLDLVASCSLCFSRLKIAAHELKDENIRNQVSEILDEKISGDPKNGVKHLLQVLESHMDKIQIKKPFKDLKVACYYGCLLGRPKEIAEFEDEENPQVMDKIISALGGEPVEWAFKAECCGGSHIFTRQDIVLKLSHRLLQQAKQAGADCLAVVCPVCHSNLDAMQKSIDAEYKEEVDLPAIYITQLIGLAAGLPVKKLMFDKLFVDPIPLLRRKGLV